MRVLVLTWEFPPFISGGLGMACYGLIKALLELGVEVDMILPTTEDVIFTLRCPEDADNLPFIPLDPRSPRLEYISSARRMADIRERLRAVGMSEHPESYLSPDVNYEKFFDVDWRSYFTWSAVSSIEDLRIQLRGSENLFKKVREYTSRVVKYSPMFKYDLIHVHDWLTYPAGIMLKGIMKRPMVAHMHATEFDRAGGIGDERIHKIEYAGLTAANLIIAVSRYTSRMVIDRYLIDPQKIRVVHNAYSVSMKIPERRGIFKQPLVLFLGRITLQKGPDYFLNVANNVLAKYPNVHFVMAGSGDMFYRIVRGAAAKRLKDRFLFAGFLNRDQVERILLATDIFVLPSVSEPFGIAPLEAMAYGAVAIVSKQSGVSEVIKNAYKIDFWDVDEMSKVIIGLLKNSDQRIAMAKAGRDEAMAIEWQRAAKSTEAVYREAICCI